MILPPQVNLAEIAYLMFQEEHELERQARIVRVRDRYESAMSDSQAAAIASDLTNLNSTEIDGLNLMYIAGRTVSTRLELQGFTATAEGPAGEAPDGSEVSPVQQWANDFFRDTGLSALQANIHDWTIRDGAAAIILSYDEDANGNGRVRLHTHERFTSADVGGDNTGIIPHWRNDDPRQGLQAVTKRWTETTWRNNEPTTAQRMTIYIDDQTDANGPPARIEKYIMNDAGLWVPHEDEGDPGWPLWRTDNRMESGNSLPLPAIVFTTADELPLNRRIMGLSAGANELLGSFLTAAKLSAHQLIAAFGWVPTTDGLPLADDGSNAMTTRPRQIIGTTKSRRDADVKAIQAGDTTGLLDGVDRLAVWAALTEGLPVKNFMFSRSAHSAQSLRQGEAELDAISNRLRALHAPQWESLIETAAAYYAAWGKPDQTVDETAVFSAIYASKEKQQGPEEDVNAMQAAGLPDEMIWRMALDLTDNDVARAKQLLAEASTNTIDIGDNEDNEEKGDEES